MTSILLFAATALSVSALAAGTRTTLHTYTRHQSTTEFWSEGAAAADFNRDGKVDLAYGPFWYAGPNFSTRFADRPAATTCARRRADGTEEKVPGFEGALGTNNAYSDCFLVFTYDFNQDKWPDILVIPFPGL